MTNDNTDSVEQNSDKLLKHDSFLKKALEDPIVAKSFFNQHLPQNVKGIADLSTLKLEKESFIEDNLKKKISDILFSVKFEGKQGYLYILLEHQSTVDYFMAQRLFNYMNGIWQRHRIEHPKSKYLPLIYPMVFYNGLKKYTAPTSFFELFQDPKLSQAFLCEPFNIINVQETPDEEFQAYPHAGIIEFFLKKHHERNMLKLLEEMKTIWDKLDSISITQKESLISVILWYNINKIESDKDKDDIIGFVNNKLDIEGEKIMTSIATKWEQEGFQKGIQQGTYLRNVEIVKAMLKNKQDISFIAEITGLSVKEVIALKK
jgi:predicted transposase/invertase (TIGR01784 family)